MSKKKRQNHQHLNVRQIRIVAPHLFQLTWIVTIQTDVKLLQFHKRNMWHHLDLLVPNVFHKKSEERKYLNIGWRKGLMLTISRRLNTLNAKKLPTRSYALMASLFPNNKQSQLLEWVKLNFKKLLRPSKNSALKLRVLTRMEAKERSSR